MIGPRISGAKPARGAGRDGHLTAAGRTGSQEQVGAARVMIVPRRAANGRTVADWRRAWRARTDPGSRCRTSRTHEAEVLARGPKRQAEEWSGAAARNGSMSRVFGPETRSGGAAEPGRSEQGRKALVGTDWGRVRVTGQPIGTDATPERARKDRDGREPRSSERNSRTERTPADPVSAQWGSAAMPGPISRMGPCPCRGREACP